MIQVEVMIIPGRKTKRVRIDETVSFEKIKSDLVNALKNANLLDGEPSDYRMSISPNHTKQTFLSVKPSPGDLIYLIKTEDASVSSVELE